MGMQKGLQGLGFVYLDDAGYLRNEVTRQLVHRDICRQYHGHFPPHWHVHHVNGNKLDNDPQNLIALPAEIHAGIHDFYPFGKLPSRAMCLALLKSKCAKPELFIGPNGKTPKPVRRILRKRAKAEKRMERKLLRAARRKTAAAQLPQQKRVPKRPPGTIIVRKKPAPQEKENCSQGALSDRVQSHCRMR